MRTCEQCPQTFRPHDSGGKQRFCSARCRKLGHYVPAPITWLLAPCEASPKPYLAAMRRDPCAYCGSPSTDLDHIQPRSADGPNDWTNYAPACRLCNGGKGQLPLLTFLAVCSVDRELLPLLHERVALRAAQSGDVPIRRRFVADYLMGGRRRRGRSHAGDVTSTRGTP